MMRELETKSAMVKLFTQKATYVLLAGCMLAPVLFKRKLAEIKLFSYLLFASVISFILLTLVDLLETSDYASV